MIVDDRSEINLFNFVVDVFLNNIYVDIYTMIKVVALVCLLMVVRVSSIKMILYLGENEGPKCFYEYLSKGSNMQKMGKSTPSTPRASLNRNSKSIFTVKRVTNGKKSTIKNHRPPTSPSTN